MVASVIRLAPRCPPQVVRVLLDDRGDLLVRQPAAEHRPRPLLGARQERGPQPAIQLLAVLTELEFGSRLG